MPPPTCGVGTRSVFARRGPIEHHFHTPAKAARGLGLDRPDGLQNSHDVREGDFLHAQVADHRIDIGFKRGCPLRPVFGILPASLMRRHIGLCGLAERDRNDGGRFYRLARLTACFDRINTAPNLLPRVAGGLSRSRQRHIGIAPETQVSPPLSHGRAQDPASPAA